MKGILLLLSLGTLIFAQTITFRDVAQESGIVVQGGLGSCAAFADYDNDDYLDICFDPGPQVYLFHNNQDGTFTDVTQQAGLAGLDFRSIVWADYNNDGFSDILANDHGSTVYLFRNNGNGTFTDVAATNGLMRGGDRPLFLDYDRDGFLDVLVIGLDATFLYRNISADSFRLVLALPWGGNSGTCADYDNDLYPDIYICRNGPNKLLRNNGNGTFSDVTDSAGVGNAGNTQAAAFGDFDNDGDLDLYITNIGGGTNKLFRNNGNGTFVDVTSFYGVADVGDGRTCDWIDFNNDRLLDLFTTNHVYPNRLFRSMGYNAPFLNVAGAVNIAAPQDVFAASWGDYDNDGDLDAFLVGHFGQGCALMRDSGGNALHYLKIKLDGTRSNRSAIGARVRVYQRDTVQTQEISGGSGQYGHNPALVHFGLGGNIRFDSLEVIWPSGAVSRINGNNGDTTLVIEEGVGGLEENHQQSLPRDFVLPNPFVNRTCLITPGTSKIILYTSAGKFLSEENGFWFGEQLPAGVYYLIPADRPERRVKIVKLK
ncbi:MAG: CRTAC1 family protein [candidate division WOR-3 bacterium]|jgi:hypothetical protein|nr:CRTAC1 family protein [candidate division WOR-3 bacterium]MCR4423972.1 CRTAC1 family protein [candidate division WOR-3 bacterium]MDH7519609.1 CRTAC1 family protein [bacterium]